MIYNTINKCPGNYRNVSGSMLTTLFQLIIWFLSAFLHIKDVWQPINWLQVRTIDKYKQVSKQIKLFISWHHQKTITGINN